MKSLKLIMLTFAILGLIVSGCSDNQSTTSGVEDALTLDDPNGGYTDVQEAPSFGEIDISRLLEEPSEFDDNLLAEAELDSIGNQHGAKVYGLVVRWGMLEGDSSITTVTDWTGSAEVSKGLIGVRRIIRFERGQDYVVRPRTSCSLVEWVSKTTVHYDGLLLMIVDPPNRNDSANVATERTLTFTAGSYSRTFTFAELESLDEIVDVDNLGNQISFNSFSRSMHPCGGGPLNGFWVFNNDGQSGHFFGSWMSEDGHAKGHLRGHFGIRGDARVFYAKVIGLHGEFAGFCRGHWWPSDASDHQGGFEGAWAQRNGMLFGNISGRWTARQRNSDEVTEEQPDAAGFFAGMWKRACVRDTIADDGP